MRMPALNGSNEPSRLGRIVAPTRPGRLLNSWQTLLLLDMARGRFLRLGNTLGRMDYDTVNLWLLVDSMSVGRSWLDAVTDA